MTVEYRIWISIADMPFRDEQVWPPLIECLERQHPELGPVASWDDGATMVIVLASDEPDRATAAERAAAIVSDALLANGLADRFPSVFRVEPASSAIAA